MRKDHATEERGLEQALASMWQHMPMLPDDELRAIAAVASRESRRAAPSPGGGGRSSNRRVRLRWAVGVGAIALLVGSGLGFGLGSSITPSVNAGRNVVGFGFLPVQGWTVVQSRSVDSAGAARAIAANVPIDPRDDLDTLPRATLDSLPTQGVLIFGVFRPRGDPAEDFRFPARESFRLADADSAASDPFSPMRLAQHRILAGLGGYNVDIRLYFGTTDPAPRELAAAQRQLNRLVVAAERVTISARPSVAGWGSTTLFGSVDSGRAGESVTIQARNCGRDFFHLAGGAITEEGGSWATSFAPAITTTLRAVWKGIASPEITLRQRALVSLLKRPSGSGFIVGVKAQRSMWRKKVQIQSRDRRLGSWRTVKTVVLTDTEAQGAFSWTSANFALSVPRGTVIRALMPRSQVAPCYVAGTSASLRT